MLRISASRRAATALGMLAILIFAAPAGRAAGVPCRVPAAAEVIARDGSSKAWRVTTGGAPGAPDRRSYFACEGGRAPFRFEHGDTGASSLTDVPAAAIRGRRFAYGRVRKYGLGTARALVIVRHLRTHKVTFVRRAVSKTLELESFHRVVVRSNGNVAWIASNIDGEGISTYEVYKHDQNGTVRLDIGTDIARGYLRLTSGGRVQWKRDGALKSAPLS